MIALIVFLYGCSIHCRSKLIACYCCLHLSFSLEHVWILSTISTSKRTVKIRAVHERVAIKTFHRIMFTSEWRRPTCTISSFYRSIFNFFPSVPSRSMYGCHPSSIKHRRKFEKLLKYVKDQCTSYIYMVNCYHIFSKQIFTLICYFSATQMQFYTLYIR